jgi:hydrogenase-4 component B
MLTLVAAAATLLGVTAVATLAAARFDRVALRLGTAGTLVACAGGATASVTALVQGSREEVETWFATALGPLHAGIDPLSSFFLVCVFLVSGLSALYGYGYLQSYIGRRRLGPVVAWFDLLVVAMVLVVLARDALLFLAGWELMSVASFFLVTVDSDRPHVRRAGWIYLVASHAGVVFLFTLFVLLSHSTGSFAFAGFAAPAGLASACFLLALVGFGAKAGFWPIHVWLPEAHPAAPSHVSAVMSGVMIKMGIYGVLRTLDFLGPAPLWWGALLLGVGAISGVLGVLHALAQHDLKRLLAYHSVENIGIIAMGIGLGLIGRSSGQPAIAFLGFAGGLLHTLNHGLFKGLLFHAAGSILHATGTGDADRLGGLARRMPYTALAFLVGAVAISGLPPLNGFVSEWLIYVGAFRGAGSLATSGITFSLFAIVALALIGGLAAACFVKAFGIVFLGQARSDAVAHAHEASPAMVAAMAVGVVTCAAIGLAALPAVSIIAPAASALAGMDAGIGSGAGTAAGSAIAAAGALGPLTGVVRTAVILVVLGLAAAAVRWLLLRGRTVETAGTWGCGYAHPTAKMQYTAASFADPVVSPFAAVFHRAVHAEAPQGSFPEHARYEEHLGDRAERVLVPGVEWLANALRRVERLQTGRVQMYLAYVLITLVVLLCWQVAGGMP